METPSSNRRGPKTHLFYDIETAPALGLYFGRPYDVNIAKNIQREYVFGFAWQWNDRKKVESCYIWDFPEYNKPIKFTGNNTCSFRNVY